MAAPVRTALHAAIGVPRLFAAALRAGSGPVGATQVVLISAAATRVAASRGRGEPGRQNAVRHFAWQALITARLGLPVAQAVAEAQETGTPNAADSRVDRHNNAVGQEYGAAHADELAGGSVNAALGVLAGVALEKWAADELLWVNDR